MIHRIFGGTPALEREKQVFITIKLQIFFYKILLGNYTVAYTTEYPLCIKMNIWVDISKLSHK